MKTNASKVEAFVHLLIILAGEKGFVPNFRER
jgi:hypothetical protein